MIQGTQEDSVVAKDPEKEESFLSLCLEQKLKNRSMTFSRDKIELSTIIGQGVCVCVCVCVYILMHKILALPPLNQLSCIIPVNHSVTRGEGGLSTLKLFMPDHIHC